MRRNSLVLSFALFSCMLVMSTGSPQASPGGSLFYASGDTREIEASGANDSSGQTTPSVPLGYPMPSSPDRSATTKTAPDPSLSRNQESSKAFISYAASTKIITLVIPRSQNVKVSAHVLNGQTISRFSTRKFLTAGSHTIRLDNTVLANGIIVFTLEGEGFSIVKKINLTEER